MEEIDSDIDHNKVVKVDQVTSFGCRKWTNIYEPY